MSGLPRRTFCHLPPRGLIDPEKNILSIVQTPGTWRPSFGRPGRTIAEPGTKKPVLADLRSTKAHGSTPFRPCPFHEATSPYVTPTGINEAMDMKDERMGTDPAA